MSQLCSASSDFLAIHLNGQDIRHLSRLQGPSSGTKTVTERLIDIELGCNLTVYGPENSSYKFEVLTWKNNVTLKDEEDDLCGTCSFCRLLADSIQRSAETDAWNLKSTLSLSAFSDQLGLRAVIHFEKLAYQLNRTLRATDKRSLRNMSSWDVHLVDLLLLTGHIVVRSKSPRSRREMDIEKSKIDLAFELFGEQDDTVVKLLNIRRRPLGPHLWDSNVMKMRHWIEDCDEHHDRCWADLKTLDNEAVAVPFLPARIIDVGDASTDKHPRLVITSEMQPLDSIGVPIKYMALSYCWGPITGQNKLLKTTHETIGSRIEKIELETMPQTFQDAITVARQLEIQYLWIDSLCIIQDDSRDWQIESSKMADIFSSAYLTLIAASGSGCNDSFLNRRTPEVTCTMPVELNLEKDRAGQVSLRFRRRWGTSDKMSEITASRWLTRGWTFQEERLARRVLIFGENKFFFNCRTLERAEDADTHELRPDWVTSITDIRSEDHEGNSNAQNESNGHWEHWQTLCKHYSYRELTFPEDKLPAISGMASRVAKKVQSDYLAGLWRNNLVHDLFWQTKISGTMPSGYRAPSWSWASLDGKINWPHWRFCSNKCSLICKILDVQTTPLGLDPYGAVKDGSLKIQGGIKRMKIVWMDGELPHSWRLHYQGKRIGNVNLDIERSDSKFDGSEIRCHALAVTECKSQDERKTLIRGLLFEETSSERGDPQYKRIATFTSPSGVALDNGSLIWYNNSEQIVVIV